MSNFVDSFWNVELCNFSGYEILCRHMRNGKQVVKEYVDFLRQRAQVQEAYGRALVKLTRTSTLKDDIGFLQHTLAALRVQTENVGLSHISTAMSINDEANRISRYVEHQRERRKQTEDVVRRQQTILKSIHKKVIEHKKMCESRLKEVETVNAQYQSELQKVVFQQRDAEKWKQRLMKSSQALENADQTYKSTVHMLEVARARWETETLKAYQVFQSIEEERIKNLRNSVWLFVNLVSVICVVEDQACESIRKILERCDVKTDIQQFIDEKRTGSQKPACVQKENIYSDIQQTNSSSTSYSYIPKMSKNPELGLDAVTLCKPTTSVAAENRLCNADGGYESVSINSKSNSRLKVQGQKCTSLCRVICDFQSKSPTQLSLLSNAIVKVVSRNNDDWWEVESADGKMGLFPAQYMERL